MQEFASYGGVPPSRSRIKINLFIRDMIGCSYTFNGHFIGNRQSILMANCIVSYSIYRARRRHNFFNGFRVLLRCIQLRLGVLQMRYRVLGRGVQTFIFSSGFVRIVHGGLGRFFNNLLVFAIKVCVRGPTIYEDLTSHFVRSKGERHCPVNVMVLRFNYGARIIGCRRTLVNTP